MSVLTVVYIFIGNYGERKDRQLKNLRKEVEELVWLINTEKATLLNKSNYQNSDMISWFNSSWFAKGDHPAKLIPFNGYIAPPLDGVWVTAPYLHNGSVPDIDCVLNSTKRPTFWKRNFAEPEYDYAKLGWKYSLEENGSGKNVYNTTIPGYGNDGHRFGDKLTDSQRKAIIEYLKTL